MANAVAAPAPVIQQPSQQQPEAPTPIPKPTIEVAGVQSFAPAPAPPATATPPPPPCLAAASVAPVLNPDTGEQVVDQMTGLPMWLTIGDDTGAVTLGLACSAAPEMPLGLPATGDGSAASQVDSENVLEP